MGKGMQLGAIMSAIDKNGTPIDPTFVCGSAVNIKWAWLGPAQGPGYVTHAARVAYVTIENPADELSPKNDSLIHDLWFQSCNLPGSACNSCWINDRQVSCGWSVGDTKARQIMLALCVDDAQWFYGSGWNSASSDARHLSIEIKDREGCKLLPKTVVGQGGSFRPDISK